MITPSRLALARKRRGMTLVRLATATGISTRSLTAYESGRQQPTAATARSLARALSVPAAFLLAGDIEEIAPAAASFRALSKMTAAQRDTACSAGRMALLISDWIEERFVLPTADVPALPGADPEKAAQAVRTRWGLGQAPVGNLIHLLESRGVRVFSLAAECAAVDAFSLYWHGTPVVFLNTMKSGERGRFDGAHELGHLVLHAGPRAGPRAGRGPEAEQEASRFAAAFLMPARSVIAARLTGASVAQILAGKRAWNVSALALAHRLHELGLISDWAYRQACAELARAGYKRGEPGGIPRETSQLLSKVFRSLRDDGVPPRRIARDLSMTVAELNSHVFGLVPTALPGGTPDAPPVRPKLRVL